MESIVVEERTRHFLLHLPKEPRGRPLIIALHALGSNPLLMEATTNFSEMADQEGFIAAYPEGVKASNTGVRSWNARFCCQDARAMDVDDIGFLSRLIDEMIEKYHVKGVLVTGFSNGGMLAHLAGIELADKITAIAPVAATVGREILDHESKRPVPALIIHGTYDRLVPFDRRNEERFLPVAEAVDYWVKSNRCSPEPEVEYLKDAIAEKYVPMDGGADVLLYKVKGAGHVWPGSKVHLRTELDPRALDASKLIWEFFRSHL